MTPRELVTRIDQWKQIEKNRDALRAYIANGGDPDKIEEAASVKETNSGLWAQI